MVPVPADDLPVLLPKTWSSAAAAIRRSRRCPSSSTPRAPSAADRRGARRTRWIRSSIRRGTSSASAIRRTGSAFRPRQGRVLGAGRLLQRRRRARDPAPDLLAVLLARLPRSRHDDDRRAVHAPADAGHGPQGRPGHVEVEGQRRRSRRHDPEVRRRRASALRDVRRAARERDRVDGCRPRGQLPVPGARVAAGRSAERDDSAARDSASRISSSSTTPSGRCGGRRTRRSAG